MITLNQEEIDYIRNLVNCVIESTADVMKYDGYGLAILMDYILATKEEENE